MWTPRFCVLCGCSFCEEFTILQPDHSSYGYEWAYDGAVLDIEQTEWIENFRALSQEESKRIIDPDVTYDGSVQVTYPAINDEYGLEFSTPSCLSDGCRPPYQGKNFLVPAHDNCLQLAHQLLSWRQEFIGDEYAGALPMTLARLYQYIIDFKSLPQNWRKANVEWEHRYYGLQDCWSHELRAKRGYEWMVANPLERSDLTTIIMQKLHSSDKFGKLEQGRISGGADGQSSLEMLPAPAIDCVLKYLDLASIFALQCSSSTMFNAVQLTNQFWKDRFLNGEAVPWIESSEMDVKKLKEVDLTKDWRGVARSLMDSDAQNCGFRDETLPIGIRNRIRIWKIISRIRNIEQPAPTGES